MEKSTAAALALTLGSGGAIADAGFQRGPLSEADMQTVSPVLARYADTRLVSKLWKSSDLSPRGRSLTTMADVIARNQTILLPKQLELAK